MWASELTVGLEASLNPAKTIPDAANNSSPTASGALPIAMLGVSFDNITLAGAVGRIEEMIQSRTPHYVVTANVDFLVQSLSDVELHRILLEAHLVLCDGTPLLWASGWLGNALPERVAGSDLTPMLLQVAAAKKYRLFLLGSTPEASARAVANLHARHPELIIAGHYAPPFSGLLEMDHEAITERIRAARPDIMLVSLGCPKQEKWIAMHYRALGVPVTIGVGAVIDFLAGQFKRAPLWVQKMGCEWIFRLLQEPRRLFRRYAVDLWHFGRVMLQQWWSLQLRGRWSRGEQRRMLVLTEPEWQRVHAPARLDAEAIERDAVVWKRTGSRHCLLDVSDVEFIDSTGIGWLLRLKRRLGRDGRQLVLIMPSAAVARALELMNLSDYFLVARDAAEARRLVLELDEEAHAAVAHTSQRPVVRQSEITSANTAETWGVLQAILHEWCGGNKTLCVDVSQVRFMDSTGLGLLIRARKEAGRLGTDLRFSGAQPNVRNVLRLARLEAALLEMTA